MNVTLKALKVNKSFSEETTCFTANIYVDGKKAGTARNRGCGGPTQIDFNDRKMHDKFNAYCATLPETKWGKVSDENFIDDLVYEMSVLADYKRVCRTKTAYRLKGGSKTDYWCMSTKYSPKVKAWLENKYGDKLIEIINETIKK